MDGQHENLPSAESTSKKSAVSGNILHIPGILIGILATICNLHFLLIILATHMGTMEPSLETGFRGLILILLPMAVMAPLAIILLVLPRVNRGVKLWLLANAVLFVILLQFQ